MSWWVPIVAVIAGLFAGVLASSFAEWMRRK